MIGMIRKYATLPVLLAMLLFISACNLTSAPQEQLELTDVPTNTVPPTRTLVDSSSAPTPVTVTSLPFPTAIGQRPTVILPPTVFRFPTATPLPVSIVILSPVPGNTVAGNVQVIGAASHPNFLQYQLEWGPDPNPGNLWFPASGVIQTPVTNGVLGTWNTTGIQDGLYQLRLRVYLRDGTSLSTVVNAIRIQNQVPTLVPTATTIPRPIAAFSQDRVSGQAPLVVRFINQSSGNITSYSWNFGDGGSSSELNPSHTFRTPGVYNVQLRVRGPGGTSNVSRQISVQGATPPVAGFTQDRTSGPSPLTVQFTDQSQGNITQRTWNFGDGSTSNAASPSHTFDAVGTYNVILTVSGPGGSSSVTRQITVENPTIPEPIAALVVSQTEGEAPLSVQFDATDSSGQIDNYNWNFGDGQLGNGQIVNHTYTNAGTYEASLVVVGPGGQSTASTTITVTQPPDAPVADFAANPTSGDVPLTVQFDASASTGPIDSYNWIFGDGSVGTGETVEHTFTNPGTYTVELTVEGPGGTNSVFMEISAVEPIQPPEAAFESSPTSGPAPLIVEFTNQSTGDELTFEWNFDDGTTTDQRDPTHQFENPGEYNVVLNVSGPGGTDSASATIVVTEPAAPPSASFDAFPTSGPADLTVQFTNQTAGEDLTFAWGFGDGGNSDERNPQHTFADPGEYSVTLTVTDADGRTGSAEMTIQVDEPVPAPDASFEVNPPSGEAPLIVQFDSTGDAAYIDSYFWEFGDNGTSIDPDPQHVYSQMGNYTVRLTVMGSGGEAQSETTISVSEAVVIAPPTASFTIAPVPGVANETVSFTNTTTGDTTEFEWQFGDGNTSTERDPQHVYAQPGDYTVTLIARGPGGENSAQQPYSVIVPAQAPTASFTISPEQGIVNETVSFTNTTTGDATEFEWQFGDGTTSTERDPQHVYAQPGDYTVTLIARGPGGENSAQQPYTVSAPAQTEPGIVEQLPILPDLNAQGVRDRLQAIFNNGASQGKRAGVFIVIGGDMAIQSGYLDPFADPGLDSSGSGLQSIIDWYNQVDVGNGRSSFDRNSFATGQGWLAQAVNNPDRADGANCNPGETPLECEIRLLQPAVAIISVGLNDTDPERYRSEMEQILQTLVSNGVIPIVSTVQPNPADPATVSAINEALIQAVQNVEASMNTSIPVYNLWRAYNQLPNSGLEGDNRTPATAPGGPGDLSPEAVSGFGTNARHHNILTILDQLRNLIFPSAAP